MSTSAQTLQEARPARRHAPHAAIIEPTFDGWRESARRLLEANVSPPQVTWRSTADGQGSLLPAGATLPPAQDSPMVSRAFLTLAEAVVCHRDPERWDALYRVLFRLTHGEPSLLHVATDPDVHRIEGMARAVRRATHKMHAFVRFRAVEHSPVPEHTGSNAVADNRTYIAWFEPAHHVVERACPLFVRRFASMRWSILTPERSAHWDGSALQFSAGVLRTEAPTNDVLEELWRSYYAHIFNPARVSLTGMQAEMPKRYWADLPEARLIAELKRDAPARVARMLEQVQRPAAQLPRDLQSQIGAVTVPLRTATAGYNAASPARARSGDADIDLNVAGAWDPEHDPGAASARLRAERARAERARAERARAERTDMCASACISLHGTTVRVGTASWTDPTLLQRGVFYPDDVATPADRLHFYASRFPMVEVDATYYVMPTRAMAAAWTARTPDDFVFDVKAYGLMTGHAVEVKRMPDWLRRMLPRSMAGEARVYAKDFPSPVVDAVWERFVGALQPLESAGKLGPILLQFPRWFTPSRESADALRAARERLGTAAAAVEFRNPAWVTGRMLARTMSLLEGLHFTYVVVDTPPDTASSMPPVVGITTPGLAIVRLHGRRTAAWEQAHAVVSERYRYLYDRNELRGWAQTVNGLAEAIASHQSGMPDAAKAKQGVHVVHNNCHANYGTSNADEITAMLIGFDRDRLGGSTGAD